MTNPWDKDPIDAPWASDPIDQVPPQEVSPHSQAQTRATGWQQTPGKDPGLLTEFLGGAKHAWDRAAYGLAELVSPNTTGNDSPLFPSTAQRKRELQEGAQFVKETGPASTIGQVAGDVALSAPVALKVFKGVNAAHGLKAAIGAEAGVNAGYGALTADEGEGLTGAAWGGGASLGGQALGQSLGAIRQGAKPTADALAFQKSIDDAYKLAGAPPKPSLTPGQLAPEGSWLRQAENAVSHTPFIGAPLRARQEDAVRGFQQVTRHAAMPKVDDEVLPSFTTGWGGGKTIDQLQRGFGDAYDDALKGVEIAVGRDSITNVPITKPARALQQYESQLKEEGYRLIKSPALDSQEKGQQLLAQAEQLANLWRPQVTGEAAVKLQAIDDAYGRFIPIKAASQKTNATLVTPENYSPAMVLKETRKAKNPETLYQGSIARQADQVIGSVKPATTFGGQLGLGGVGLASILTGAHIPAAAGAGLALAYGTKTGQKLARGAQRGLTSDEVAAFVTALRRAGVASTAGQTRDE